MHAQSGSDRQIDSEKLAFVVGRDRDGHWLAVELHGLGGGFFTDQRSALRYASFETDRRDGAVRLASEPIELRL